MNVRETLVVAVVLIYLSLMTAATLGTLIGQAAR